MSDHIVRVSGRPRSDGLDFDRLAQALLEFLSTLSAAERRRLAARGAKLLTQAENERRSQSRPEEGAA